MTSEREREPQYSESCQRSVIGAALVKPALLRSEFKTLTPDDFYGEPHRRIFRAMLELYDEGDPVTADTVAHKLALNGDAPRWVAMLEDLAFGAVPEGIGKRTVAEIKKFTKLRKLRAVAESIESDVENQVDPEKIAASMDRVTSELRESNPAQDAAPHVRPDMPDSVLDGRLGEICQHRLDRLPVAYAWGALVTTAGALIDRSSEAPLRTNLYWCPVGAKGSGKSVSMELAFRVLGMWPNHSRLLKAKFGSAEALIENLEDIEPAGVRIVAVDELGHLMAKSAIERSSFPFILNTGYYEDQQTGGSKGRPWSIDCRLSLMGALVEELFADSFGVATIGGLYDRFTFGLCPEPYEFLWHPFDGAVERVNPFPPSVDPDVWEARTHWVKTDGIQPRVAEHALRVAYICAAFDGRPKLRAADLEPALSFAKYQMRVRLVLAPNPGENADAKCAVSVRNWLRDHVPNGEWATRRELHKGIHAERYGPTTFNRTLKNLAFNSEIDLCPAEKRLRLT